MNDKINHVALTSISIALSTVGISGDIEDEGRVLSAIGRAGYDKAAFPDGCRASEAAQ